MKKCTSCKKVKELTEYSTNGKSKAGTTVYRSQCKECRKLIRVKQGKQTGLGSKGELNHNNLLSVEQVMEIKQLLASGAFTHKDIAFLYGVSKSTITAINTKRMWGWL